MAIFSKTGLAKLEAFQQKIQLILATYPESKENGSPSSEYSKQMARNAIDIIKSLKENNNTKATDFKELKKILGKLENLIGYIDDQNFTGIPVVFNEESAKLAQAFVDFLKSLKTNEDFEPGVNALISAKGLLSSSTAEGALQQHIKEVEAKLNFYQKIVDSQEQRKKGDDIQHDIVRYFGNPKAQGDSGFISQWKDKNLNDPVSFNEFKMEYEKKMRELLTKIQELPYVLVSVDYKTYLNRQNPFVFNPGEISTTPLGSRSAGMLISLEKEVNDMLKAKSCPQQMNVVSQELGAIFTDEVVARRKNEINDLYGEFNTRREVHKKGGFLKTPDPKKVQLLQNVHNVMTAESKKPDHANQSLMDVFKKIHESADANVTVSKGKSLGQTALMLREFEFRVLEMMLDGQWGNDEKLMFKLHPEKDPNQKPAVAQKKAP